MSNLISMLWCGRPKETFISTEREQSLVPKRDYGRVVLFDTNVVEARYLAPLLRGEQCRDLLSLSSLAHGLVPMIHTKSLVEVIQHAKNGTKTFPWLNPELGYPGGMDIGRRIVASCARVQDYNLFLWYGVCEEWWDLDWDEERLRVCRFVRPDEIDEALQLVEARRQFTLWKRSLTAFCDKVVVALTSSFGLIGTIDYSGAEYQRFELEFAKRSLVPSEDFEIVASALYLGVAAIVSDDEGLRTRCGLTQGFQCRTAFIRADQLKDAVDVGFESRWWAK